MKLRVLISLLALALAAALAIAGCGGGGNSSGSDPATLVPPKAPVYIEATVKPQGTLASNIDALAKNVAGIDDVGQKIVEEVEKAAAQSRETFKYTTDVGPWLGEKAGLYLENYDGDNFHGYGIAVEQTDSGAAQEFIDKFVKADSGGSLEDASYEGVDFKVGAEDGEAVGIVGDFVVFAETEADFKAMVDASEGESLSGVDSFTNSLEQAPDESLASVYVDIGGLIEGAGQGVDPETEVFLESAGLEPKGATALASVIPDSDQVEIDFSSDVTGKEPRSGDASKLLGSLPGGSFAAFASADFGKRFGEAIDRIDANGIPGQVEPNELKGALSAAGIDLDKISASIGDLGVFAQGNTENNLTGALVLTTKGSKEASNTVANVGLLLRAAGTPSVTAISGKASGFSVHSPELGRQPLVVAAQGSKIAISYGLAASAQALSASSGATLSANPAYEEAVASLGDTPISGFVAGPAALALAESMIPAEEQAEFEVAKPYLDKVSYVAIGAGASDELTTAKIIVGFAK
ncbi:MAG: DUF3352 domain-containing protein [Solirubrobacterales bacterium]|nr:DUF3352 domain-containing protein [Solirubrobacterales bacterium]